MKKLTTNFLFVLGFVFLLNIAQAFAISDQPIPFEELNPAPRFTADGFVGQLIGGGDTPTSGLLSLAIILGGLILLVMIIMSGFTMMTNPQNPQAQEAGKTRLTWSVVGFLILFSAYWLVQIIEVIFGLNILGQTATSGSSKHTPQPGYTCVQNKVCISQFTNNNSCYCVSGGNNCSASVGSSSISCCGGTKVAGTGC